MLDAAVGACRPLDAPYLDISRSGSRLKHSLVIAFAVIGVVYFAWRATVFNPAAPTVSAIFYATEFIGYVTSLIVFFVALRRRHRNPIVPPPDLHVDVFVTTFNEDLRVVRRTLVAATRVSYPHVTWLLDDGDRPDFRALAVELGCCYLSRSRDARGAKAGNINNALRHASGDYVLLLDADHCPQPNILDRVLGYFVDPDVAFVQTPQDYYNTGSFQHGFESSARSIWHEQTGFHHVLQPGRDWHEATTLCGCSCVLRRAHLDRIGGFPEETVTEDMHAAVRLAKLNLKSVYHDEPLAFGLAPPDFRGFLRQRLRWGEGNMQVCRLEGVPFTRRLNWRQNVCYALLALTYVDSWRKLVHYTAPALTLLLEIPPIISRPIVFLLFFVPYLAAGIFTYCELFGGFGRVFLTETFDIARLSSGLASSWGLFRRDIRFRVSSKRLIGRSPPVMLLPQATIGALCATAVFVTVLRWIAIERGFREPAEPLWIDAVLLALCLYHFLLACKVMMLAERSGSVAEDNFLFHLELPLRVVDAAGAGPWLWTRKLSLDEAILAAQSKVGTSRRVSVELLLPDGPLRVEADHLVGQVDVERIAFIWSDVAARDRLDQALHAGRWHRVLAGRSETGLTFLEWLGWLKAPATRMPAAREPWRPLVVRGDGGRCELGYLRKNAAEGEQELIRFGDGQSSSLFPIESAPVAPTHGHLLIVGTASSPMLEEGALDPLGAERRVVRFAAIPSIVTTVDGAPREEGAPIASATGS